MKKKLIYLLFFVFSSNSFSQVYDVEWIEEIGCSYDATNKDLINHAYDWNYSNAASTNLLPSASSGYISYTVTDNQKMRLFGFNTTGLNTKIETNEIAIGAYIRLGVLWVYDNGSYLNQNLSISNGDVLLVEKDVSTGNVYIKQNGTTVYTYNYGTNTNDWIIETAFKDVGGVFDDVKCSFNTKRFVTENKIINEVNTNTGAAIDITTFGDNTPFSYSWSSSQTTEDINSIGAGSYSLTITDNSSNTLNESFKVYNLKDVEFDNLIGCLKTGAGTIRKTNMLNGINSGANTLDYLDIGEDGVFSCKPSGPTCMIGFREGQNTDLTSFSDIKFGFYFITLDRVYLRINGINRQIFDYSIGDEFSLERIGNRINYRKNGEIFYYVENVSHSDKWFVDMTFTYVNEGIDNLKTSFINRELDVNFNKSNSTLGSNNGEINLDIRGGKAPYTISWSNGATTQLIQNLSAGDYTYTVTDNNQEVVQGTVTIEVNETVEWENPIGGTIANNCFTKNTSAGWTSSATSIQKFKTNSNEVVGFEYELDKNNQYSYALGFDETGNTSGSYTSLDLGICILTEVNAGHGRRLYAVKDGALISVCTVGNDDIVTMEYESNEAYIYVNNQFQWKTSYTPTVGEWVLDANVKNTNHAVCNVKVYGSFNQAAVYNYASLRREYNNGFFVIDSDVFRFIFESEYNENELEYKILDEMNNVVLDQSTQPLSITSGINKLDLPISSLTTNKYYLLEVRNSKEEKFYLRFYKSN